jgi:hypothetical protein
MKKWPDFTQIRRVYECTYVTDSEREVEQSGALFVSFERGSDATNRRAPTAGDKKKQQKKYPQKPNLLFLPRMAIRRESAK